jgi:hypothetical protein
LSVSQSVSQSVCLSVCLSVYLPIYLFLLPTFKNHCYACRTLS